jgi:hypothetical protein
VQDQIIYRVRPESWVRGNWRGYKFRVIVSDNGVKGRGDRGYNIIPVRLLSARHAMQEQKQFVAFAVDTTSFAIGVG